MKAAIDNRAVLGQNLAPVGKKLRVVMLTRPWDLRPDQM